MKKGFYTIMSAQFFSSLADNALLVAAIELLRTSGAPSWHVPALTPMFALFYVILAPGVGAFADAVPKGKVMLISISIKIVGCLLIFFLMIRRPPRSTLDRSSAASDVYKRQVQRYWHDANVQVQDFQNEGIVASGSWPFQANTLLMNLSLIHISEPTRQAE